MYGLGERIGASRPGRMCFGKSGGLPRERTHQLGEGNTKIVVAGDSLKRKNRYRIRPLKISLQGSARK